MDVTKLGAICEFEQLDPVKLENYQKSIGYYDGNGYKNITNISESFCSLKNLYCVRLNGNKISVIPESFGKLTALESFHFNNNIILLLPESLVFLTYLAWVELKRNKISVVPESIRFFRHLRWIYFEDNKISIVIPNKHVSKIFIGSNNIINL